MSSDDIFLQPDFPADAFDRYLAGEATAEDQARIEQWRLSAPLFDGVADAVHGRAWSADTSARDVDLGWQQIQARAFEANVGEARAPQSIVESRRRPLASTIQGVFGSRALRQRRFVSVSSAACLCVALIVGVFVWKHHAAESSRQNPVAYATYTTRTGQVARVTLLDGTRVVLAPNSSMEVARDFARRRDVTLLGEAYFDVAHTHGVPFVVHTGVITTRVLGTTFDVQRYPSDVAARVTVTSGKVLVGGRTPQHPSVTLTAGMTGMVSDSSISTARAEQAPYVGWIDGQLVFHKASTVDVLAALTRWYGYQFRLADSSLAHRNLTLGLSTDSPSAALATLKQVLDVELTFDQNIVTLHPKRGAQAVPRPSRNTTGELSTTQSEVGR